MSTFPGLGTPTVNQLGCTGHTTVSEIDGRLALDYPPSGVVAGDPDCPAAWGGTDAGSLRGCAVQVSVHDVEAGVQFLVRDFGDGDNFGTFGAHVTTTEAGLRVQAVRFGPTREDPGATTTYLGDRDGLTLPLRLFIANPDQDRACTGIVVDGRFECIGCWEGDPETSGALDGGSMFFAAGAPALLDDLNVDP